MSMPTSSTTQGPLTPKGPHGGARRGAGRKPNTHVNNWYWMQIGAMLTPNEHTQIKHPHLTPAQRRHRLLTAPGATVEDVDPQGSIENLALAFVCVRVAYSDATERDAILALTMPERRRRLLTIPPGGDLVDQRPGRWDVNKP